MGSVGGKARRAGLPEEEPGKTNDHAGADGRPTDRAKASLRNAIEDRRDDGAFQSRIRASIELKRTILGKLSER